MIELTLTELAAWAIGVTMVAVGLFGWVSHWSARNAERRSLSRRVTCRLCQFIAEEENESPLFLCPKCGAENERGPNRNLG